MKWQNKKKQQLTTWHKVFQSNETNFNISVPGSVVVFVLLGPVGKVGGSEGAGSLANQLTHLFLVSSLSLANTPVILQPIRPGQL